MKTVTMLFGIISLALAVAAGPASAAGKGKGPRASLAAATVCDVVGSDLEVTIRLTDKTSGSGEAVVTGYTIDALAKTKKGRWDIDRDAYGDAVSGGGEGVNDDGNIETTFDLCDLDGSEKGLNAAASITYRLGDGSINSESRTIYNMCSDDPSTEEVEPAGIKLTSEILAGIDANCP